MNKKVPSRKAGPRKATRDVRQKADVKRVGVPEQDDKVKPQGKAQESELHQAQEKEQEAARPRKPAWLDDLTKKQRIVAARRKKAAASAAGRIEMLKKAAKGVNP